MYIKNVFVLVVMLLSLQFLSIANASDLRGPKIFGLQLGMSWDEAKNAIKQYASKYNKEIEFKESNGVTSYSSGGIEIEINKDKGILSAIIFSNYKNPFQVNDIMDREFLDQFCKRYDISLDCKSQKNQCVQINRKDGYKITIHPGAMILLPIIKSSEFVFE